LVKLTYKEVQEKVKDKGCKLLTTENEYNKMTERYKKVDIISKCGHENKNVNYQMLMSLRECGLFCRSCVIKSIRDPQIIRQNGKNKNINTNIERDGFNIIKKNVHVYLDIIKTNECCLADFYYKPKWISKNLWLPVQLKVTNVINNNCYSFKYSTKYSNMIIIKVIIIY
jgi:hypothetical protein